MALWAMCHGDAMGQRVRGFPRYARGARLGHKRPFSGWIRPREGSIHPENGSGAEGVGFEPTVACATTVFETVRFGRSRIPPSTRLPAAWGGEEGAQKVDDALALDAG